MCIFFRKGLRNHELITLRNYSLVLFIITLNFNIYSQLVIIGNDKVYFSTGVQVISNGGVDVSNGKLTNNGFFQITRQSNLLNTGNIHFSNSSLVNGNGYFKIEQDWINDGDFQCDQSTVELYGNFKQFISSNTNLSTVFHDLILSGSGTNENRKKELLNVNSSSNLTGKLYLNDRELSTLTNSFFVQNPSLTSVHFDPTFQDEGFVSSLSPGYLWRKTDTQSSYLFPVGSSNGPRRFRPVEITPQLSMVNSFGVRFNNFNSDDDSFLRFSTDGQSKDLNPFFYHSIKGEVDNVSNAKINIGFLSSDGDFDGIANWNQNKWISCSNEIPNSIGNYNAFSQVNLDLFTLSHPYILANTDRTSDVFVPNTFTPDGEEFNNVFSPVFSDNKSFSQIELTIFNRWGELIFTGYGYECYWDGYYNNLKCQDGVYTWKLNYVKGERRESLIGHINLLK